MLKTAYFIRRSMGIFTPLRTAVLLLLWHILHLLISLYTYLASCITRWRFSYRVTHPHSYDAIAHRDRPHLSKIPVHLGIVFSEQASEFAVENLVELVTWSGAFGVAYVSVYDANGVWLHRMREVRGRLLEEVPERVPHGGNGFRVDGLHKPLSNDGNIVRVNGVNVIFLSESDGKSNIAKCAEDICRDAVDGRISVSDIDQNVLQAYISEKQPFPDPDLILQIGRINSLAGYLPWHIRLSEIIYCPRREAVSFDELRWALHRYARVEQRVGR